ncbi:MAG: hypothetical protein OXK72_01545 [Gammaproteobacteria bacterium]|nr:hypothetical protein [Gammaproteobacteria bacterium]MDE0411748.1 hypothetical protein [Gammaproteobacteria bacterium]
MYKHIGDRPVDKITTSEVKQTLLPLWHTKLATAKKIRKRIFAIMKWCIIAGHRQVNPVAKDALKMPDSSVIEKPNGLPVITGWYFQPYVAAPCPIAR